VQLAVQHEARLLDGGQRGAAGGAGWDFIKPVSTVALNFNNPYD
jgi:hypothetical protein